MNEKHSLLAGLTCLADAKTRSISPENFHGEKGKGGMAVEGTGKECARELGQGWKISPSVEIPGKETLLLADIQGSGIIQHIWLTCPHEDWRSLVLRFYWDAEETPSIEVPLGDFFCMGWCETGLLQSLPICVNPSGGMNCYWQMPFRNSRRRGYPLSSRPVQERQSAGIYEKPCDCRSGRGQRAVCGNLSCLGRKQQPLVGRG